MNGCVDEEQFGITTAFPCSLSGRGQTVDPPMVHRATSQPDFPARLPSDVKAAILLVHGDLYENRSANVDKPMSENATLARLLWMHRRGLGV